MLRNSDHVEGGPGDPKTTRDWWNYFKGWPMRILLAIVALILFTGVVTAIAQALNIT